MQFFTQLLEDAIGFRDVLPQVTIGFVVNTLTNLADIVDSGFRINLFHVSILPFPAAA